MRSPHITKDEQESNVYAKVKSIYSSLSLDLSSTVEVMEGAEVVQALPIYHGCCSRVKDVPTEQFCDWLTFA